MAKAKTTNNSTDGDKVFDVAKPGKTPADASARPAIVGHKPMLKDPMVKEDKNTTTIPEETDDNSTVSTTAPTIMPLDQQDTEESKTTPSKKATTEVKNTVPVTKQEPEELQKTEETSTNETVETKDTDSTKDSEKKTDESSPPAPESDDENESTEQDQTAQSNEGAAVEAVAQQAGAKKEAEKQALAEAEKQSAIEKLIEEKKYFVPIGEKKHKRTLLHILLLLVLTIALGLLLVNTLIELEIIQTNIEPPLRIFSR